MTPLERDYLALRTLYGPASPLLAPVMRHTVAGRRMAYLYEIFGARTLVLRIVLTFGAKSAACRLSDLAEATQLPADRLREDLAACHAISRDVLDLPLFLSRRDGSIDDDGGCLTLTPQLVAAVAVPDDPNRSSRLGTPLRELPQADNEGPPMVLDGPTGRWVAEVLAAIAEDGSRHFLYRLGPGDPASETAALARCIKMAWGSKASVWTVPAETRSLDIVRAPGFLALASAFVFVADPEVIVLPGSFVGGVPLDVMRGRQRVSRLPRTEAGRERVAAMAHYYDLLRRLPGVHVWCCPADTPTETMPSLPATGPTPLPTLDTVHARLSVFGPVLAAQQELLSSYARRTERQQDTMTGDLEAILDLVCGPRRA